MFNLKSKMMKFSALTALAAFSVTTLESTPASAYNFSTHSRIPELAVQAMNGFCYGVASGCTAPTLRAPVGEETAFGDYLSALRSAPAKLEQLRTGLPTDTVDGGWSVIPGDSDNATGYPYNAKSPSFCSLLDKDKTAGTARDLNRLNDFRIADLEYFPARKADPCGLVNPIKDLGTAQGAVPVDGSAINPALLRQRVTGLVLGWHGAAVDDHLNDTALWVRPTLIGYWGAIIEAASWVWEAAVGTIALPFVLLWSLFSGHSFSFDSSYAFARQYNPVDEIQGAIPGVGDIRDDMFNGLWHFEAVDLKVNRFNDTRGMWYPNAGPVTPGAFDAVILAATQLSGLSLNAHIADGPKHYGDFDKIHRTWPQWQAHSVGMLEWSPLHNLANYGWSRFKSDPTNAAGLGWPLHAIGDACEPHHVTATSSWGHRNWEEWVANAGDTTYLPKPFDGQGKLDLTKQTALDQLLADSIMAGFRWWKQFKNGEDMAALIHDLAVETRQEVKDQGDWPFKDSYSTKFALGGDYAAKSVASYGAEVMNGHDADVKRLLSNSIGATIAVLAVAAPRIPTSTNAPPFCPTDQAFTFGIGLRPSDTGADELYTIPGCAKPIAPATTNGTLASNGIGQVGAANCPTGVCGKPNGSACANASECASAECSSGVCGKPNGATCNAAAQCAQGLCTNEICGKAQGASCTQASECSSNVCQGAMCGVFVGQPCTTDSQCSLGVCTLGKCGEPNGSSCALWSECASTWCFSGQCGKSNGNTCASDFDCTSNQCSGGVCGKFVGQPCTANAQCAAGLCSQGFCGEPNGSSCATWAECASTWCFAGLCGKSNGESCGSNFDCTTNQCSGGFCGQPNGSSCSASASCASGACAGSVCCNDFGSRCSTANDCCAGEDCRVGFCAVVK